MMTTSTRAALLLITALVATSSVSAQLFGRERTLRGVQTTRYEVTVQKSAGIDIRLGNGAMALEDGMASVQLVGDKQPRKLKLDARRSSRDVVANGLGQGKSLLLGGKDFLYAINSFETQPFLTLRLAYVNGSNKPVEVEKLVVLSSVGGKEAGLMLGAGAAQARLLAGRGPDCATAEVLTGQAEATGQLAAWNTASGRVMVAGFLGVPATAGRFSISFAGEQTEETGGAFSFEWIPDTPVRLEPQAQLEVPPLYLSLAGTEPIKEVRRFVRAMEISVDPALLPVHPPCDYESWGMP